MTSAHPLARRRATLEFGCTVFGGACLGLAAFGMDFASAPIAIFVVPIVSSGSGWGTAALIAALSAHGRRSAVLRAILLLTTATLTYYAMILVVGQRWYHPEGGGDSLGGLASVSASLVFWLLGSLCGGLVLGFLADLIRRGSFRGTPVAAAVTFALLGGEGGYAFFHTAFIWVGPIDSFIRDRLLSALVQVTLAAAVAALALRSRQSAVSWGTFVAALAVSSAASIAVWHVLLIARLNL